MFNGSMSARRRGESDGRKSAQSARCLLMLIAAFATPPGLLGQTSGASQVGIEYRVNLQEGASHIVRVQMIVPNAPPHTQIQFPAWNALYQMRDFVRYVRNPVADCQGRPVPLIFVDVNTWKTGTQSCAQLNVDYEVVTNKAGIFSAKLDDQGAFLNLADILFYLPSRRKAPATISFVLPQGWKLATLLREGTAPNEYQANNYDDLVDRPVEAGSFDFYTFKQGGVMYRVVVRAHAEDYKSVLLLQSIQRIISTESGLMHGMPTDRYTFIFHFPRQGGGGGMEHADGTAISFPAGQLQTNWKGLESTIAHEFFHLWNVKRIRPAGLEPVDYVHGNDTRELWFSEGVTSTYGLLTLERSGLIQKEEFYSRLANEIQNLQQRPARLFQSAELSGMDAWLEKYPDYFSPDRSISYYNKGEILGFLLDLGIRYHSQNASSLDDLMRGLNRDFAEKHRTFTDADLKSIAGHLAGSSDWVDAFFSKYVLGTDELDYDQYFAYAGLALGKSAVQQARLGFKTAWQSGGVVVVTDVDPASSAANAGLQPGDEVFSIDGQPLHARPEYVRGLEPGQAVKIEVRRGPKTLKMHFRLASKTITQYSLEELPNPTPGQLAIREGLLSGKTTENPHP
jgi:predicted metalloprotease with PDZ domain